MNLPIYQVDAFASEVFAGNPAAVCYLEAWIEDHLMQKIAMENNLAETAFLVREQDEFIIRWFTPTVEVDLCGHATLASAHVLFKHLNYAEDVIHFKSPKSGSLPVKRNGNQLTLDFPKDVYEIVDIPSIAYDCFATSPIEAYKGKTDYVFVFENQSIIENIQPNFALIHQLDGRGVIVTAQGNEVDFVSRFFAPQSGINEDPVTGSAHTTLTPIWAKKLNKNKLSAIQVSSRKGLLDCELKGDRVKISGQAITYLIGEIHI